MVIAAREPLSVGSELDSSVWRKASRKPIAMITLRRSVIVQFEGEFLSRYTKSECEDDNEFLVCG